MIVIEKPSVKSKSWDWANVDAGLIEKIWTRVSDEFLPAAYRWKDRGWKRVLDLGCGIGRHSIFLASLGYDVVAVDLSAYAISTVDAEAKKRGLDSKIQFLKSDMIDLPDNMGEFDCILTFHTIYHTDYSGLKRTISWITDNLRKGGGLYVTFLSKNPSPLNSEKYEVIDEYTVISKGGPEKGIPHTFLDHDNIYTLLEPYRIAKLQQIRDFFEQGKTGLHYFVEAYRKA